MLLWIYTYERFSKAPLSLWLFLILKISLIDDFNF